MGIQLQKRSNEGVYQNQHTVIKCARTKTTRFGITNAMLARVTQVILAKEKEQSGEFELFLTPINLIGEGASSRSKGSAGKVSMYYVSIAKNNGQKIGEALIHHI
ncbi:hypothetical protein SDC9_157528 [bioreactor metagenome]|uniref:Uncharacterized protein n=1 Tax=bioreactor metagenome TaxID=1076179 RepID=A0A645FCY9_9ZZZZ